MGNQGSSQEDGGRESQSASSALDMSHSGLPKPGPVQGFKNLAHAQAGKAIWGRAMAHKKLKSPKEIIHVVSPEIPDPNFVELSPFDVWESRFPVNVHYVYSQEAAPTVEQLKSSLERALVKYPAIGGRVHQDGQSVQVRYERPRVRMVVGNEVPDKMDEWRVGDFDDTIAASVSCGMPITNGKSLFEVRVTPVVGGRLVVSVCMSHGLVDMQGLCQFVSDWAALSRGADIEMTVKNERSNLIQKDPEPFEEERVEQMGWLKSPFVDWLSSMGIEAIMESSEARKFTFTPQNVEDLKQLVKQGPAWRIFEQKGYRLSAHDVCTALLWRVLAEIHPYHPDEEWMLVVVVNWRGRTELVSSDYWGNATTSPHRTVTMKDILEQDFSFLALKVRELSAVEESDLDNIVAFHNHLQYGRKGLTDFVNVGAPMITKGCGLYISNFSKFDLFDADFGSGRPETARMTQPPIPGMSFAYPVEDSKDIMFCVTIARENSARLESIDCTTGRAVLRVEPPTIDKPRNSGALGRNITGGLGRDMRVAGRVARGRDADAPWRPGDGVCGMKAKLMSPGVGTVEAGREGVLRTRTVSLDGHSSAGAEAPEQLPPGFYQPRLHLGRPL